MELVFDVQGKLAAVGMIWAQDDFYSLSMREDRGLDGDGDGLLTAGEQAEPGGCDANRGADYAGGCAASGTGCWRFGGAGGPSDHAPADLSAV